MNRAQILIETWQHDALRAMSAQQGESISAIVRAILTRHLAGGDHGDDLDDLGDIAGIGSDPVSSGAEHDEVLYGWAKDR